MQARESRKRTTAPCSRRGSTSTIVIWACRLIPPAAATDSRITPISTSFAGSVMTMSPSISWIPRYWYTSCIIVSRQVLMMIKLGPAALVEITWARHLLLFFLENSQEKIPLSHLEFCKLDKQCTLILPYHQQIASSTAAASDQSTTPYCSRHESACKFPPKMHWRAWASSSPSGVRRNLDLKCDTNFVL